MMPDLVMTRAMVVVVSIATSVCHGICPNRQNVLLLMLLLMFCRDSNSNTVTPVVGSSEELCPAITPREAYFLEGEDIVLMCNVVDASNLTFIRGVNNVAVLDEPDNRSSITSLNDTAIQLTVPNVSGSDIDSIRLSIPYYCVDGNDISKCYDVIHVRLEYYPQEPRDLVCRDYDLEEMYCTWSLGIDYHTLPFVNVTCEVAHFMFKSDNIDASWVLCPEQNRTSCYLNELVYPSPAMMIAKVSVTVRNITKETQKQFDIYDIVEPGPVEDFVVANDGHQGRCLTLSWQPSSRMMFFSFKFELTYSSACSAQKTRKVSYYVDKMGRNASWGNRTLCDLNPNTKYMFSVRGKMIEEKEVDNRTFIERGHWSKSVTIEAFTDKDVIDVNPKTVAGLYEISRSGQPGYSDLYMFWTPLADCALHDTPENVTYTLTAFNQTSSVPHPEFKAQIHVPVDRIVNISLHAFNSVSGHKDNTSVVTVYPVKYGPPPSDVIIQYNKTDDICVPHVNIVLQEESPSITNLTHRLVWCEGTQHQCQKPLETRTLEANVITIVLPGYSCQKEYNYGLVTYGYDSDLGQIVNTGIQWEHCIYSLGKVVDNHVADFKLSEIQPETGFSVEWTAFTCEVMSAYIAAYKITYCIGEEVEETGCRCTEKPVNVTVSRKKYKYTATDLKDDSQICVWIRGVSLTGEGPTNPRGLVHKISPKSGPIFLPLGIALGVVIGVILIIAIVWCIRKSLKSMKAEADNIRIPDVEMESLMSGRESIRKYSVTDILEGLEEEKEGEPEEDCNKNSLSNDHQVTVNFHSTPYRTTVDDVEIPKTSLEMYPREYRESISSQLSDAQSESVYHSKDDLFEGDKFLDDILARSPAVKSFLQNENEDRRLNNLEHCNGKEEAVGSYHAAIDGNVAKRKDCCEDDQATGNNHVDNYVACSRPNQNDMCNTQTPNVLDTHSSLNNDSAKPINNTFTPLMTYSDNGKHNSPEISKTVPSLASFKDNHDNIIEISGGTSTFPSFKNHEGNGSRGFEGDSSTSFSENDQNNITSSNRTHSTANSENVSSNDYKSWSVFQPPNGVGNYVKAVEDGKSFKRKELEPKHNGLVRLKENMSKLSERRNEQEMYEHDEGYMLL